MCSRTYQRLKEEWCVRNRQQIHTAESIAKISLANKGRKRPFTAEHLANMRLSAINRFPNKRRTPLSEEELQAKREQKRAHRSALMKNPSEAQSKQLADWQKAGLLARQAKAKPKPKACEFSDPEETRRKMSEARKAYWAKRRELNQTSWS
jgi:hypothetical protein